MGLFRKVCSCLLLFPNYSCKYIQWGRIRTVRACEVKLKFMLTSYCTSSMSVVTSDSLRSFRVELCLWTPCGFPVDPVSRLPVPSGCLLTPPCKLDFREGGGGALESSYTGELKCHGLKNILSWCDEYFTVGIFLVSVVSFLRTHRSTYSSWDRRLCCLPPLLAQVPLWPKRGLKGKHRFDSLISVDVNGQAAK